MIYLIRTTIEVAEIAALEDGARLAEYRAAGWQPVDYSVYREAWRRKHTRPYGRLLPQPAAIKPAPFVRCPQCSSGRVTLCTGGLQRRCRKCEHVWDVQERGL